MLSIGQQYIVNFKFAKIKEERAEKEKQDKKAKLVKNK
jgi:membrane protein insertase Oxa1/YidC/SpoIIIJ